MPGANTLTVPLGLVKSNAKLKVPLVSTAPVLVSNPLIVKTPFELTTVAMGDAFAVLTQEKTRKNCYISKYFVHYLLPQKKLNNLSTPL